MSDTVVVAERRCLGWQGILSIISVSLVSLLIAFLLGFAVGHCSGHHGHGGFGGPRGEGMREHGFGGGGEFHHFGGGPGFGGPGHEGFHGPWADHGAPAPGAPAPAPAAEAKPAAH